MRSLSNIITMALAAAATAPGCWAQDAPNQQCLDDAGPPWADVPVYYENRDIPTFDRPLLPDDGQCPEPLAEACATKSTKAAYLEGPISCPAGKGWFCRIAFQDGWSREMGQPGEGYLTDSNFMHCNQTSEGGGGDGDGHCHGSDADSTYGWWVRDHWNRGYAGTLNCCCGWSDLQELAIVNRCDYRHTVYDNNTDPKYRPDSCRDANEEHGMGFDLRGDGDIANTPAGCPSAGNPTFRDPLDANPDQCWSIQNFGYNDDPPGTLPPTRPATPTPPPSPSAPSAPTPAPPTSRPIAPPSPTRPQPPCSSDARWRDDDFNGCDSSQIIAAWCRNNGDEMFEQADGSMMSGNQACTQCGACNTAPTTRSPTTTAPTTTAPTTPAPTTSDGTMNHRLSWGFRSRNVSLSIIAGDTVTWAFDQDHPTTHDVVSGVRGSVDIGALFRSERQTQGEFSHTFTSAGAFPFFCSPHYAMSGTVTVSPATSPPTPPPVSPPTVDDYCPEGYDDYGVRYNWGLGKITIVTAHAECEARCTQFSGPQYMGGCKAYMTGMYFGMLLCRSYGGNIRTLRCPSWAVPTNAGVGSGQLGNMHPRTNQMNIGGNCCSNSTFVAVDLARLVK